MNDRPIRTRKDWELVEIKLPVRLSDLDALSNLISWLDGFEAAGKAQVPGHFELVMHYRALENEIMESLNLITVGNENQLNDS